MTAEGDSVGSGSGVGMGVAEASGVIAGAALAVGVGDGQGVAVGTAARVGERKEVGDSVGLGTGEVAEVALGRTVAAAPQSSNIPPSRNNRNRPVSGIIRTSRRQYRRRDNKATAPRHGLRRRSASDLLTEEGRGIYHLKR